MVRTFDRGVTALPNTSPFPVVAALGTAKFYRLVLRRLGSAPAAQRRWPGPPRRRGPRLASRKAGAHNRNYARRRPVGRRRGRRALTAAKWSSQPPDARSSSWRLDLGNHPVGIRSAMLAQRSRPEIRDQSAKGIPIRNFALNRGVFLAIMLPEW